MASADAISQLRLMADPQPGTGTIPPTLRTLVPQHAACAEALRVAEHWLPAAILNHSFRVFLYAHAFLALPSDHRSPEEKEDANANVPLPVLFTTAILHDIGAATVFDSRPQRFEVLAADAVAAILRDHGCGPEAVVRESWLAVALHASPGIAEALGGVVRAVRLAVLADFGAHAKPDVGRSWPVMLPVGGNGLQGGRPSEETEEGWLERALPRLDVEKVLGDRVVEGAMGELESVKAPGGSWPGDLVRAKKAAPPGWEGVNPAF
ncbi:uncharacterized protein THITE_2124829 [Thermothielavioides terrestris NRRL 8126]|uniref:HD/PDEase domain-containing protein n=1 Tax=Thermothielavioides terrestris (strain ATCC 38088 / NRRL 8126) TaxID=578455 RepID=G2RGV6_THETT|nr:uncharacterized protein THITE_2124829 [Thermothielavioides terrestris NRRL 8126]AEO71941.1 hypothetical protein THITE_2124829 [Thermothielavioides terrestris NRRL 8126]